MMMVCFLIPTSIIVLSYFLNHSVIMNCFYFITGFLLFIIYLNFVKILGFWCHEDAPIIHPVGWSREIGHEIVASQSYHEKCSSNSYDSNDASLDLFLTPPSPSCSKNSNKLKFVEGMKLEAIDPLNLATICVATVMKVRKILDIKFAFHEIIFH